MTQWLVKDLSKLTGISVQTLHHYDRVNLLKPSLRLPNGYRIYSEKDLIKLQQIIALKFFGFSLSEIKILLAEKGNALVHFNSQVEVLEQKAASLQEAARTLKAIIESVDSNQSISWETIIQMIEVYKMTAALEHGWVKEIFTPDELKQYAEFEKEMKAKNTKDVFERQWQQLLNVINEGLKENPDSITGIQIGEKYMRWINGIYPSYFKKLSFQKLEIVINSTIKDISNSW